MSRKRYKTMSNKDKYIFVALTNMILARSKTNYECYITSHGNIHMHNIINLKKYVKNGIVLENKELIQELKNKFLHMEKDCYIKTNKETSSIYKNMLMNYLNS